MKVKNYREYMNNGNKYRNVKTATADGAAHASILEARRWGELNILLMTGKIKDLERQKPYTLIPAQYAYIKTGERYKKGPQKGKEKTKRVCLEQSVVYKADFVYTDKSTGQTVVEDTKGFKTDDYIIKRKLMLYIHGIRVREIR